MANRSAFIDFAQGLLNLNPLERWTPNQAKLHPFITQQKYTGPFVPPMTLRSSSSKSPAPGVQEQQRAEAMSKQRQQQAAAQAQAQSAAYASMQMNSYPASPMAQPPPNMYNMYNPGGHQAAPPPPYQQQPGGYASQPPMGMMSAQQTTRYQPQPPPNNLYAQATTRAGRQRASTLEQHYSGIPAALQRVMGHLDPNAPIRLQPSPAYYPPPPDGAPDAQGNRRRASRAGQGGQGGRGNRDFIRTLEDRTLEEGFMSSNHWQ
jgi:dual specificity protein kinase YAK1